jgi:hypothetical protein
MSLTYDKLDPIKNQIRLIRYLRKGGQLLEVSLETVSQMTISRITVCPTCGVTMREFIPLW